MFLLDFSLKEIVCFDLCVLTFWQDLSGLPCMGDTRYGARIWRARWPQESARARRQRKQLAVVQLRSLWVRDGRGEPRLVHLASGSFARMQTGGMVSACACTQTAEAEFFELSMVMNDVYDAGCADSALVEPVEKQRVERECALVCPSFRELPVVEFGLENPVSVGWFASPIPSSLSMLYPVSRAEAVVPDA